MRMRLCVVMFGLAAILPGCDSPGPPLAVSGVSPPHHGTLMTLPDDRGLVEILNEPEVSDRRKPEPTAIVVYFLQTDGKSALVPAPEDVSFAITPGAAKGARTQQESGERIALSAEPKSDDPLGGSRFASKLGRFALTGIRGTLTAKIGGQNVSSSFGGNR
jgi:hypothetical protein